MEATGDGVGRGSVEEKARGRGGGARRRWVARTRRQGPSAVGRFVPPIPIWIGEGERDVGIVGSGMGLGFDQGGRGGLVGRRGGPAWLGHGPVGPGAAGSFLLLFLFAFFLSFHNFLFCFF